jgi:hypothetical protein
MWLSVMARWLRSIARSMPEDNTGYSFAGAIFCFPAVCGAASAFQRMGGATPTGRRRSAQKKSPGERGLEVNPPRGVEQC